VPIDFDLRKLLRDLELTVFGSETRAFLFKIFPPEENKLILEPGCRCGKFGLSYALAGCEVIMIDIDPEAVNYARRIRGALNSFVGFPLPTQIRVGNIHRMCFSDNHFDLVFNEGVPQHWPDEKKRQGSIDQMVRVSNDMVIVVGNNGLNPREVDKYKDVEFPYMGMPPKTEFFTPNELEMRLKKAGLKKIQVEPITPGPIENSTLIAGWGRKS